MEIRIESNGGVGARARLGGHTLVFDQAVPLGGSDAGPSPLDVMFAAVGACAHYYAAAFLTARGIPVEGHEAVAARACSVAT